MDYLITILISFIPAAIAGVVSYLVARKNAETQIALAKDQSRHEYETLIAKFKHDFETQELEHKNALELSKKESEAAVAAETTKGLIGVFGSIVNVALSSPEGQRFVADSLKKSQCKNETE